MAAKVYTLVVQPKYIKEFTKAYKKAHTGVAPSPDFIQARLQKFIDIMFEDEAYPDWLKQPHKCFKVE